MLVTIAGKSVISKESFQYHDQQNIEVIFYQIDYRAGLHTPRLGYFRFVGIGKIYIYTEFYHFKFYDDVSISHFFISGLFLLTVLILLIRNHARERYSGLNLIKIGAILLLIVFLSLSFFMSYSFGMNAKLKQELPLKTFNADKRLLNVLNPFLYPGSHYNSETLFNVTIFCILSPTR